MGSVVALDVGGSGVRGCLVESGVPGRTEKRSLTGRSVEEVLSVCEFIVNRLPGGEAVGVALPGFASHGKIHSSPNFPEWSNVPFGQLLEERIGLPVHVENDASSAAWGAYVLRGRREDLVLLTLGTGVGGGIVSSGKLLTGKVGCGAELGHLYVGGTAKCGCGATGCLEARASTSGLIRIAESRGKSLRDGAELWSLCEAGETWALELACEAGEALGRGIGSISNAINPEVVVLSGGLCFGRKFLEPALQETLAVHAIPPAREALKVEWGGRAEEFSLVGIADLAESLPGVD